jgi:hypothetical protein
MAGVVDDTASGGLRGSPVVWLAALAIVGAGSFLTARAIDGARQAVVRQPTSADALSAHCAQFIALAKQQYGVNWKYRLDPRNGSICAGQVQQAWDRQWRPGADPQSMPPVIEPDVPPPPAPPAPVFVPVAPERAQVARSDTYCLNLVSLAKAKYGPGWQNTITVEDAEACRARIQTSSP